MPDEVFGFKKQDAYALKALLKKQSEFSGVSNLDYMDGALVCVATNGVPARVGTTLGKASVEQKILQTSGVNNLDRSIGTIASNDKTITAYNLAATAVATGAYIIVLRIAGAWIVVWEEC